MQLGQKQVNTYWYPIARGGTASSGYVYFM